MTLRVAHDISESLQINIESFPEVRHFSVDDLQSHSLFAQKSFMNSFFQRRVVFVNASLQRVEKISQLLAISSLQKSLLLLIIKKTTVLGALESIIITSYLFSLFFFSSLLIFTETPARKAVVLFGIEQLHQTFEDICAEQKIRMNDFQSKFETSASRNFFVEVSFINREFFLAGGEGICAYRLRV